VDEVFPYIGLNVEDALRLPLDAVVDIQFMQLEQIV